jgi:hypothetical protein
VLAITSTGGPAAAQTLTVKAVGSISPTCSLSSGSFGEPNLAASGSVTRQATVNCNTGFKVNARSTGGALVNVKPAPANFANTIPYNLTVSIPLDNVANPISATCSSSALMLGQNGCALSPGNATGLSSGGKSSINKTATLTLAYTVPTVPTRLVAGTYSDTIIFTIAAAQ